MKHHPELSEPLLRAWRQTSDARAWDSSLDGILDHLPPEHASILVEAVNSSDADIRVVTVWSIVRRLANRGTVPGVILDAALPTVPQEANATVTWEQFGRELIARMHRATQTPDRSQFLTSEAAKHTLDAQSLAPMTQLLESERKALRRANVGVMVATYSQNGRVAKLQVSDVPLPAGCTEAVSAVARLTVADFFYSPTNAVEVLVLPLDAARFECLSRPEVEQPSRSPQGATIEPPRKIRDVRPEYPVTMQNRRISGTVWLEVTITQSGCTKNLRVMHGVEPMLDFAALRAVAQWRFTPATLDGRPVSAVMTVSANFTLQ